MAQKYFITLLIMVDGCYRLIDADNDNLCVCADAMPYKFDKEQVSTDGCTSDVSVYFFWNNWRNPLVRYSDRLHLSVILGCFV